jgi:hypothetical protein
MNQPERTKSEQIEKAKLCQYTVLPNGIHEFIFREESKRAIDVWLEHAEHIYQTAPPDKRVLFILDGSDVENLPLAYSYPRIKALNEKYPNKPPSRGVLIYSSGVMNTIIAAFTKLSSRGARDESRFYHKSKRDEAIQWLLEAEDK